jgi:dsDNA-specific endonuclease/ATPase MutS2
LRLEGAAVLTGPNMGGKTAALRTCGFVAACVVLGLPVPASAASVPLFDEIAWVGLARGEHQEAAGERQLLSSFGAEVVVLRDLLERRSERALVLVDEFARTTTPREGRALLVALLQVLRARGALALAATHLHGVAREAGVAHFAIVGLHALPPLSKPPLALAAALSLIGSAMDYRLRRGDEDEIDRADALALAELLGLDPDLIRRARADLRVST